MKYMNDTSIILASASPRRRELLENARIQFSVIISDIDESAVSFQSPKSYVRTLARLKAEKVAQSHSDQWVLGADTIVTLDDRILEKPNSRTDALEMLRFLNNRTHEVYTGFCLIHHQKEKMIQRQVATFVTFTHLTDTDLVGYIDTGEPFDKAGGYGIQGMGAFLVKNINGSYTNVVGLPVCEVLQAMSEVTIIKK